MRENDSRPVEGAEQAEVWHLAQLNVARALEPLDSPRLAGFVAELDAINALGERSPGFVWRLQGDGGNATDVRVGDDPLLLVNMSVWASVEALFDFVYRTSHTAVMAGRRTWFEKPAQPYLVLWWVPGGHVPTVAEGLERLELLRQRGPSPQAFTFKRRHPAPGTPGGPVDMKPEPYCSGWA